MNDDRDPASVPHDETEDDDERISSDDASLDEHDKALADSFPASDPPAMP